MWALSISVFFLYSRQLSQLSNGQTIRQNGTYYYYYESGVDDGVWFCVFVCYERLDGDNEINVGIIDIDVNDERTEWIKLWLNCAIL